MNKTALTLAILALAGCQSEQEKIHEAQVKTCKEQIQSGQEPTPFCLNLLPEYRAVAQAQQQPLQQYTPQQYAEQPQQPVAVQQPAAPVIVNQPAAPAQNNGMTDMLVGGLIGHAIGSSGNNSQAAPVNNHYYDRPSTPAPRYVQPQYVERNTTIIKQAAPTPAPVAAPKKNYMDTSKLNSYGARPAAPARRSSSMNMGKLSSYGKR